MADICTISSKKQENLQEGGNKSSRRRQLFPKSHDQNNQSHDQEKMADMSTTNSKARESLHYQLTWLQFVYYVCTTNTWSARKYYVAKWLTYNPCTTAVCLLQSLIDNGNEWDILQLHSFRAKENTCLE